MPPMSGKLVQLFLVTPNCHMSSHVSEIGSTQYDRHYNEKIQFGRPGNECDVRHERDRHKKQYQKFHDLWHIGKLSPSYRGHNVRG